MRSKALTAFLMVFACAHLCSGALLTKPTRPAVRDSSRRNVVATPSSIQTSRSRVAHHAARHAAATPATAHRPGRLTTAKWTRAALLSGSAKTRPAVRSAILNHVEARARASYAATKYAPAVADAATINRVHAWELTHRNPPRTTPLPQDETPSSGNTPSPSVLADDAGAPSNLLRTTPELPRIKSIEEEASTPVILPSLYDQRGRLVVPAPLYGSHEVLLHQNQMANRDGLNRVQDNADLLDLRRDHKLVALPVNEGIRVDERLPLNRRYSRPWTADFLTILARNFYASFHEPLQVNSAVRTVDFQRRLLRTNGNAAPATGDTASPHLTGQAVDIGKGGLSRTEIAWMRTYLQPLIEQGKIDVEEEFQQSCFHISVYRSYQTPDRDTVAATHQSLAGRSY